MHTKFYPHVQCIGTKNNSSETWPSLTMEAYTRTSERKYFKIIFQQSQNMSTVAFDLAVKMVDVLPNPGLSTQNVNSVQPLSQRLSMSRHPWSYFRLNPRERISTKCSQSKRLQGLISLDFTQTLLCNEKIACPLEMERYWSGRVRSIYANPAVVFHIQLS